MGYTNYLRYNTKSLGAENSFNQKEWNEFIKNCKTVLVNLPATCSGKIAYEYEDAPILITGCQRYKKPHFSKDLVWFNGGGKFGVEDLDHETCVIHRNPPEGHMEFCKTQRKPYDLFVKAVLILFKAQFPHVEISSDGDDDEWEEAMELVKTHIHSKQVVAILLNGFLTED
jgi:hypothetical protein